MSDVIFKESGPCELCAGTGALMVIQFGGGPNDAQGDECPHCLRRELTAAKAELATAKEILGAFKRRHEDRYLQWTFAGGVNDCKHGFGEGIPCPKCDLKTIIDYVDAATAQTGKQKGVKE